ncbi:hypothetical protein HAL013_03520 [Helicobacter ailurogastricus]|uniref:Uncharacterized protein n=1 Tax=Helicobacter ailurogastricus TaxID=1578720 RepID=A0A0K2X816_9HELI|nr:hypothetical protein HAL013_03520 [Helicobacter ailurogastricus]
MPFKTSVKTPRKRCRLFFSRKKKKEKPPLCGLNPGVKKGREKFSPPPPL